MEKIKSVHKTMIRSMTGFGKASVKSPYGTITAEIKSLNHKSLSVGCNVYNGFFNLEEKVKKVLEKKMFRGKVFVNINTAGGEKNTNVKNVQVNEKVLSEYFKKIKQSQKRLKITGEIGIMELARFPGVVETVEEKSEEKQWPYIQKVVEGALKKLLLYRQTEGSKLAKDFYSRLHLIEKNVGIVKKYGDKSVEEYRKKLIRSIKDVSQKVIPDKSRLEAEVASFARNCDVAEEITRLSAHTAAYKDAVRTAKAEVGKKLDFIAQEMQREANTIGAKSNDFKVAKAVIEIKSEIEKLREQIRNIE